MQVSRALIDALHRARALERLALSVPRRNAAIHGTSALLIAAREAGWRLTDLADGLGISAKAAAARVANERRRRGNAPVGLIVDPPPPRTRRQLLALPVDQRDWLTNAEATRLYGWCGGSLSNWRRAGLLPRTDCTKPGRLLYHRADLDRIRDAPWTGRGVYRQWVRDAIARRPRSG